MATVLPVKSLKQKDLQVILDQLAKRWQLPGAQLSVSKAYQHHLITSGLANRSTQSPVTETTRFQLGSTTKLMLAYCAHCLVEEGHLDLDAPIETYLEAEGDLSWCIGGGFTARALLTHQSGLCGDAFLDLGDRPAAEDALLAKAETFPVLHSPNADTSYCNIGYVLLGGVLRQISGLHWTALIQRYVAEPLASKTLDPWPRKQAGNLAVGHLSGVPSQRFGLPASNGAAGTSLVGTALDLSRFGTQLLDSLSGQGALSQKAAASLTKLQAPLPPNARALGFGQGAMVFSAKPFVFGHDGLTIGQQAFLRVFADTGLSVALVANGGDMRAAARDLFASLTPITGYSLPPPDIPGEEAPLEAARYDRLNASLIIAQEGDAFSLSIINHEAWAAEVYGPREGPFKIELTKKGAYQITKPGSAVPMRLHLSKAAAYLGLRRYNRRPNYTSKGDKV